MSKLLTKWYISLVIAPIIITYLTNYFSFPLLLSDWKLSIIFSLVIFNIILAVELKIQMDKVDTNEIIIITDTETTKRLFNVLNIKMLQEEILRKESWNGYLSDAIGNVIEYQYESRLIENRFLDKDSQIIIDNFNDVLESFTDYSSLNMYGGTHSYLIPFKYPDNKDRAMEDSKKIDKLAKDVYKELEILITHLKKKGYWN